MIISLQEQPTPAQNPTIALSVMHINPVNNLRRQMSVWRQSNVTSTLNWRWTDVRLTSANVDCLLGRAAILDFRLISWLFFKTGGRNEFLTPKYARIEVQFM